MTDIEEIKAAFNDHYQALFALRTVDATAYKNGFLVVMLRLDEETKQRLEPVITESEVEQAMDKLNTGNSPGSDGLSAAFYKEYKCEVGPIFTVFFNEPYEVNLMMMMNFYGARASVGKERHCTR